MIKKKISLLIYLLPGCFIIGWWILAFHPLAQPIPSLAVKSSQSLALNTSTLLQELSLFDRETIHRALTGDLPSILKLIEEWDRDAQLLADRGVVGIERLSDEALLQAQVLGYLLTHSSQEYLHQLNCKMNLEWMEDDIGRFLHIQDHFHHFLPQSYLAASFLLAIAHPDEIIALPKGLREQKQIYPPHILAKVPVDVGQIYSERLYLKKPDLAFVAPYSHPPSLEALRNQHISLYSLHYVNTIQEIKEALLKVGHASNHILEAQLLATFMDACFLAIDNRLCALNERFPSSETPRKFLYLSHRQHYSLPTTKCLTGQLMARALKHCPHLSGVIPENSHEWRIPLEQEQIVQLNPELVIISSYAPLQKTLDPALRQTQAYKLNQVFYVDEEIQDSPTQYIALAYFDLFQALASL